MPGVYHAYTCGGRIVLEYVLDGVPWCPTSDALATRVLGLILKADLRGHSDGVYIYDNGEWTAVEEIPVHLLRKVEEALSRAAQILAAIMKANVTKDWDSVVSYFENNMDQFEGLPHITSATFQASKGSVDAIWARDGGKSAWSF